MRQIALILSVLLSFTLIGTLGFRLCEGWDWLQCVYEAVIIMTTVGLSASAEPELQPATKAFIIGYLVLGVGVFSYSVSRLGQQLINLELRGLLERRRMDSAIERLRDHYIVCGFGRMGQTICQYLQSRGKPFVVVDVDQGPFAGSVRAEGWLYLVGDATHDETLRKAGIERAKALASVLPTDADNVYVVLSARLLNDRLQIIARASDEKAIDKMQRAGATRVVSPFSSGAIKMARFMLNPSVEDFLEFTDNRGSQLELADVQIAPGCRLIGQRLMDTDLRNRGVMIIGIRRSNGERLLPPPGTAIIEAGDCLFAFGSAQAVSEMITESVPNEDA